MDTSQRSLRKNFCCTNCRKATSNLYRKYSDTVLKLTECDKCKAVADKYVEYDIVIILIDVILLNTKAYRHILLNTDFKNFWKLLVIIILTESYCNWSLKSRQDGTLCCKENKTEPNLYEFDMNIEDLRFYVICLNSVFSYFSFVSLIYVLTLAFNKYFSIAKLEEVTFATIVKTMTLSSTGIFLQLPSIIWDISLYNYHLHFITLYTSLSQLLAYRAIFDSPKIWCLCVIFSSHLLRFKVSENIGAMWEYIFVMI
ncbi:protein ARV1 [Euwallacea fornicatus]|uniref:protein ARV1 n=1 Tax=Euwallacea fornicatus TaxID=995702 RepID=UPI00338F8CB0